MSFEGWSVIENDPFFVPVTKEEIEEHGEGLNQKNYALEIIEQVR
jgi:hypothetical protein